MVKIKGPKGGIYIYTIINSKSLYIVRNWADGTFTFPCVSLNSSTVLAVVAAVGRLNTHMFNMRLGI